MLNFFRKIRRKLAFDNKFGRYVRYAIGEVLLIMLGIFMALELQNWNENRKKEIQFKNTVEQLYNELTDDSWYFSFAIRQLVEQISDLDNILKYKEGQSLDTIPGMLWSVPFDYKVYQSRSLSILENLEYNLNDKDQVKLANQLSDYEDLLEAKFLRWYNIPTNIEVYLIDHNIPYPKFNYAEIDKGFITDSTYYTKRDLQNVLSVLTDENYRTRLRSHRTTLVGSYLDFKSLEEESISMLGRIKAYYPEVKLLYEDVGIIGTSINGYNDVGAGSTPMILTNEDKSIWEIELYLKEGTVKFRCRDSWAINWGGETFPRGVPLTDGPNIPVPEAGNYKVVLNITDSKYEFIKLEE